MDRFVHMVSSFIFAAMLLAFGAAFGANGQQDNSGWTSSEDETPAGMQPAAQRPVPPSLRRGRAELVPQPQARFTYVEDTRTDEERLLALRQERAIYDREIQAGSRVPGTPPRTGLSPKKVRDRRPPVVTIVDNEKSLGRIRALVRRIQRETQSPERLAELAAQRAAQDIADLEVPDVDNQPPAKVQKTSRAHRPRRGPGVLINGVPHNGGLVVRLQGGVGQFTEMNNG